MLQYDAMMLQYGQYLVKNKSPYNVKVGNIYKHHVMADFSIFHQNVPLHSWTSITDRETRHRIVRWKGKALSGSKKY